MRKDLYDRIVDAVIDGHGYDKRDNPPSAEAQREAAEIEINGMQMLELLRLISDHVIEA